MTLLQETCMQVSQTTIVCLLISGIVMMFFTILTLARAIKKDFHPIVPLLLALLSVSILGAAFRIHKDLLTTPGYARFRAEKAIHRQNDRHRRNEHTYRELIQKVRHETDSVKAAMLSAQPDTLTQTDSIHDR